MKILHHPQVSDIELSSVLYALSDPTRLGIVAEAAKRGATVQSFSCTCCEVNDVASHSHSAGSRSYSGQSAGHTAFSHPAIR